MRVQAPETTNGQESAASLPVGPAWPLCLSICVSPVASTCDWSTIMHSVKSPKSMAQMVMMSVEMKAPGVTARQDCGAPGDMQAHTCAPSRHSA